MNPIGNESMRALRLPSIRIYRPVSDSEFVERTRRKLDRPRVYAWPCLVCLVMAIPCFLYFLWLLARGVERLPDEIQNLGWAAVAAGFFFGGCLGPFMMGTLMMVLQGFGLLGFGRSEQLLVRYYDLVHRSESPKDTGIRESESPGS
jgi:hypothetical protein